jgi:hypothetical protein
MDDKRYRCTPWFCGIGTKLSCELVGNGTSRVKTDEWQAKRSAAEALNGSFAAPVQAVGYEAVNGAVSLYHPVVDVRDQIQSRLLRDIHRFWRGIVVDVRYRIQGTQ